MSDLWSASQLAGGGLAWILTYLLHSTLLLGAAFLWSKMIRSPGLRESLWKAALVGGIFTASLQTWGPWQPVMGRFSLEGLQASSQSPESAPPKGMVSSIRLSFDEETLGESLAPFLDRLDESEILRFPGMAGPKPRLRILTPPFKAEAPPRSKSLSWRRFLGGESADGRPPRIAIAAKLDDIDKETRSHASFDAGFFILPPALLIASVLAFGVFRARRRLHRDLADRQPCDGRLTSMLEALRKQARVRRSIRLTVSDELISPLALGRSEICLPRRALEGLDEDDQESLLAHELAHLVREDGLWFFVSGLLSSALFFQPLNRLAFKKIREEAEYLCDDWAVRHTGRRRGLAQCLAQVASWLGPENRPLPAPAMASSESPFVKRVKRLCGDDTRGLGGRTPAKWVVAVLVLTAFVGLAPAVDLAPPPPPEKKGMIQRVLILKGARVKEEAITTPNGLPVKIFRL